MTRPTVELHPAHVWTCDACGRDNFCRGVIVELTEEDKEEMLEAEISPESAVTGQWLTMPDEVTCSHCGAEYETTDPHLP